MIKQKSNFSMIYDHRSKKHTDTYNNSTLLLYTAKGMQDRFRNIYFVCLVCGRVDTAHSFHIYHICSMQHAKATHILSSRFFLSAVLRMKTMSWLKDWILSSVSVFNPVFAPVLQNSTECKCTSYFPRCSLNKTQSAGMLLNEKSKLCAQTLSQI